MKKLFILEIMIFVILIIHSIWICWYLLIQFPKENILLSQTFFVEKNTTANQIAHKLYTEQYIPSELLFKIWLKITFKEKAILAGQYRFNNTDSFISIAHKINTGKYETPTVVITIKEGDSAKIIAQHISEEFTHIPLTTLKEELALYEGYLYPETYYFSPTVSIEDILEKVLEEFEVRVAKLRSIAHIKNIDFEDIVIMASIIELETSKLSDKYKISGVLWNRIHNNIPLQVDVTFQYINGKTTFQLSTADLKKDHPYNTYTNKGLPPTPIASPSYASLDAAVHPEEHEYYYFLADHEGKTHFSKTFEEHRNKKNLFY